MASLDSLKFSIAALNDKIDGRLASDAAKVADLEKQLKDVNIDADLVAVQAEVDAITAKL